MNVNTNLQINQATSTSVADSRNHKAAAAQPAGNEAKIVSSAVEAPQPSIEEIQTATKDLSEYLSSVSRALSIAVDSDLNRPIVTVMDSETDEVVRQIPNEELVAIAKFLKSQAAGSEAAKEALSGILLKEEG